MKYFKNILVLASIVIALLLSVKSGYAEESYNITSIKPTSTQTLDIELNRNDKITGNKISSDLSVYQEISIKSSSKETENSKTVILTLEDSLSKGNSYSILSISGVEGSIEFKTGESLDNEEFLNSNLDGEDQGINKIIIKDSLTIEIIFLKTLGDLDFEFKVYKDIEVKNISVGAKLNIFEVILKDYLEDNREYVGTLTFLEDFKGNKMSIDSGFYDFSSGLLAKYEGSHDEIRSSFNSAEQDDTSLEETLLNALDNSEALNNGGSEQLLDGENQIVQELNSAGEQFNEIENTQLENLALTTGTTPDTGAETWVLIILTFIINTFYFFSRRKVSIKA